MGISWLFLFEAYRRIGVSIASLGYYCGPVIVMALAPVMFHEKNGFDNFSVQQRKPGESKNESPAKLSYSIDAILIILILQLTETFCYTAMKLIALYFRSFIFPAAKNQSH